jgi:hypothetical protein
VEVSARLYTEIHTKKKKQTTQKKKHFVGPNEKTIYNETKLLDHIINMTIREKQYYKKGDN